MDLTLGRIRLGAAALILFAVVFFLDAALFVWILSAAAVHEAAHLLAVRLCGGRVAALRVAPWGLEMSVNGPLSYTGEIISAAAGPAASLLLAVLLSAAGRHFSLPGLFFASGVSFVFGAFNALPVLPLDGGRILFAALSAAFGPFAAERAASVVSCAVIGVLLTSGSMLLIRTRTNFTLLAAAAWLLISYCKRSGISIKLTRHIGNIMH